VAPSRGSDALNRSQQAAIVSTGVRIRSLSITGLEALLLPALLAFGFTLIVASVDTGLFNTLFLLLFVALAGVWACNKTWRSIADPKLRLLGTFWLIKLAVTLVLLYLGWIPQLDPGSAAWGYDPQRYYQESYELILNDWSPTANLNYQGILYYYAAFFYVFGHNPVVPAIVNAFATLLASLFLIRYAYAFAPIRTVKDWRIAGLLLIPEVLWFDVMTSRETLMAILIIVAVLVAGKYMVGENRSKFFNTLVLFSIATVGILFTRTTMIISVVGSIAAMVVLLQSRSKMGPIVKVIVLGLAIASLAAGPLIQQVTGGYDVNYLNTLDSVTSFENNIASEMEWTEDSVGLLLAPNSTWQAVAFLPPRMVLYLAAPLPKIEVRISDLLAGSWEAWQLLMTLPTSVLMLLGFPYVLAGSAKAWHDRRKCPSVAIIPIAFWVTFAAVAGGNFIIHERYRVMFTLLFFACVWLGHTQCRPVVVHRWALLWFAMLGVGALAYLVYKVI
jgi:hypothetical protein